MKTEVSAYLLSSLKEYFGREKGERIAHILSRSGIRCFDDLASGVPDALMELMEVSRSSFVSFLEEYGPQAIAKLKERVRELENQLNWAKERIQEEVGSRTSMSRPIMGEIEIAASILSAILTSIQLCCERNDHLDENKAKLYSETIREVAERLRRFAEEGLSEQLKSLTSSLDKVADLMTEMKYGELEEILKYALSLLSDLKRTRASVKLDEESLLRENLLLKSKIISLLCEKLGT